MKKWFKENSAFVALIMLVIIAIILKGEMFFNQRNLINIFLNNSIIGIIALGMTLIIITGGIDLAVGSQLAASGLLAITVLNATGSIIASFIVATIFGIASGGFTGILISKCNIPPFIVTLGTMSIYRSVSQHFFSGGGVKVMGDSKDAFIAISNTKIGGQISMIIVYWIVLGILIIILANKTTLGRHMYAVGSNEKATRLAGINVDLVKIKTYAISGLLVSFASIIEAARLGSMNSASSGSSYEMDAIAAVVIGGTSMAGGKGKIIGTIFGTLTLGVINNIMNLLGVPTFLVSAIKGAIIIGAVLLQTTLNRDNK
ncbi:MAG: ribose ABC transporter permease [Candidatus Epulonipiscium fishelsonii]|nr:MAG: ribose ABC transporter permease [Epulopiscium sp. AS2M-Bin002]